MPTKQLKVAWPNLARYVWPVRIGPRPIGPFQLGSSEAINMPKASKVGAAQTAQEVASAKESKGV